MQDSETELFVGAVGLTTDGDQIEIRQLHDDGTAVIDEDPGSQTLAEIDQSEIVEVF